MRRKLKGNLLLFVLLFSFFDALSIQKIQEKGELLRLHSDMVSSSNFREQSLNESVIAQMEKTENPGLIAALYLLESKFSYEPVSNRWNASQIRSLKQKWSETKEWLPYEKACYAVWNDLEYFPVPESSVDTSLQVLYKNSWMNERTYGGKRGHEGTDVMASRNQPGLYPVLSMTDGKVTSKGWLEKGGWRIGVTAPGGGYFYYAHLDSYASLNVGDRVKAGDLLGYMGDSGYGKEGTTGQFPVHLHVGIYLYEGEKEISINPYWILKYLEKYRLKYTFS